MLRKTILAALLAAAIPTHAVEKRSEWSAEPTSFLGIDLFQGITPQIPVCPDLYDGPTPATLCHDKPYDGKYYSFRGLPKIGVGYTMDANTIDGSIQYLYLKLLSDDFDKLKLTFESRYGQPTKSSQELARTGAGGEFTNDIVWWEGKKVSIKIERYTGDIRSSSATVYNNSVNDLAKNRLRREIESGASNL